MDIYAFTDIHGNDNLIKEAIKIIKSKKPELIVCPGDLTIFGHDLEKILNKFNQIKIPFLVIHGNHEDEDEMKKACKKFDNVIFYIKGFLKLESMPSLDMVEMDFQAVMKSLKKYLKLLGKRQKARKLF